MSATIYLTPRMLLLCWLGMVSGLPLALTASTLTAWLADSGVTYEKIGIFALVGIPYIYKFMWAPLMDGLSPPMGHLLGRRRTWMIWSLLLLASSIFALSLQDASDDLQLIALFTLALAFCSASFDINMDALRIEWLPDAEQGAGAAMAVFGYRLGMIVSSAGALYLAAFASWQLAYQAMGAMVLLGIIPTLLAPNPKPVIEAAAEGSQAAEQDPSAALGMKKLSLTQWVVKFVITPFREFSQRPKWWMILLFILLFKLGDAVLGFMTMPFLIQEAGYAKETIAEIVKIYGLLATIIGGFIGGWMVIRLGVFKSLLLGGILQAIANVPYAYLAMLPETNNLALGLTIAADNAFGGIATTAFIAYISGLCNKQFTATQYALLNSFASVGRIFFSAGSGAMVASMGWPLFFVFTAFLGLPSLVVLWWLRRTMPVASK